VVEKKNVDSAQRSDRLREKLVHAGGREQVGRDANGRGAMRLRNRARRVAAALRIRRRDHELRAFGRQRIGCRPAKPFAGGEHQRAPAA
jgi:hypothetical protein